MKVEISGLVLAGGQGRRMGGVDKGLQPLMGRPLIQHVIERLSPQVHSVLINANQNLERYAEFGCPVVPDRIGGFAGPLAGLDAGLHATDAPLIVTVPCDSPFLPHDLVARLATARSAVDADIAVARTGDQPHPVFALVCARVRSHLANFLARGERKIDRWYADLKVAEVAFDDEADAFANINTRAELAQHDRP
ncbi:MAG TPA: molybdenum cofactor guanylyltransferase MobA [Burkholderiaceae bacterium]|nr:molybdenum cofactor guanylyltransferase MobA [Burkholderiaceae bacterium]HQR69642.1 molybdenum cofactor guanylyltransferase MobA [Burkholderiaceae bacterium]